MKLKNNFLLLTLLSTLFIGLTFTSCSDDDDDSIDYSKDIVGEYEGNLTMGGATLVPDMKIKITRNSNTSVTLSINQFIPPLDQTLNVQCPSNVTYDEDSEQYESIGNTTWNMPIAENVTVPVPINVDGIYYDGKKADIDITVKLPAMGEIPAQTLVVNFFGEK